MVINWLGKSERSIGVLRTAIKWRASVSDHFASQELRSIGWPGLAMDWPSESERSLGELKFAVSRLRSVRDQVAG